MSELAIVDLLESEEPAVKLNAAVIASHSTQDPSLSASLSTLQEKLGAIVSEQTNLNDGRAVRKSFSNSDAFVVVSPVFSDTSSLGRLAMLSLRARLANKPFALVGLGVNNLTTRRARFLARFVIRHADLVLVRDEESADALIDAGVEPPFRLGADPAWAQLDELYAASEPANQMVVAIDLTDGKSSKTVTDRAHLEDTLSNTLTPLVDSGVDVVLQPWKDGTETNINQQVAKNISARLGGQATVVEPPATLREARKLYSESRMVVATRRHALMAAAVAGSRAVSLVDECHESPHVSEDAKRLSKQLDLRAITTNTDSETVSKAFFEALESDPAAPAIVRDHIDRAKGSLSLVRLLLTEGAAQDAASIESLPLYPTPWRS